MKRYIGTGRSNNFPEGFKVKTPVGGIFYGRAGAAYAGGIKFLDWMVKYGYLTEAKERILENE